MYFRVLVWVSCAIIGISAWEQFMCVRAQNSVQVLASFAHAHVRNNKICAGTNRFATQEVQQHCSVFCIFEYPRKRLCLC